MKLARLAAPMWVLIAVPNLVACVPPPPAVTMCTTRANCPGGLDCIGGICQMAGVDGGHTTEPDAAAPDPLATCTMGGACATVTVSNVDQVDLLLVLDNSNSMTEEQQSLVTEIPRIIRVLTSGDREGDGLQDFQPARSLHVGIISTDMGTGPVSGIESCDPGLGDDGIMRNTSIAAGCAPSYPSAIFDFTIGEDPSTFADAVGCVAAMGTGGCGFEQQLEATLKAVSVPPGSGVAWTRAGYTPPTFFEGTFGHGGPGGRNDGFLRPSSVLAVILVSDEEDCSANDPSIFDPADPRYSSVDLNLRCHMFQAQQWPVQRYVDGLIGLRSSPQLLVFGAIVGVPLEAVESSLSYAQILDLPAMQEQIDPVLRNRLLPSCTSPAGRGVAYPPRRIVQVAAGLESLGAATTIQSICNTSFGGAVDAIVTRLSDALLASCLPRVLPRDGSGEIACEVFERLPAIGGPAEIQHCSELPNADAYTLVRVEEEVIGGVTVRRELCEVRQVSAAEAGTTAGWFYDDGTSAQSMLPVGCDQRISFSVSQPVTGAELVLVCPP